MSALGRGFVAVVPPDDVLDAIEASVAPVRDAHGELRWSRREQWHLTLRFLGPVPDLDALVGALRRELASAPRIEGLQLERAGAYPTVQRAAVVWLGVGDGDDALTSVAEAAERAAVAAGFAPDARSFSPHLTVARVPRPRDVTAVLAALGDEPVGTPWVVDDVVLVSSETQPSGAVYAEVARVPIA